MSYLLQAAASLTLLFLAACSSLEESPAPSSEALKVRLTEYNKDISDCQKLGAVIAYGSFTDEVNNDLRHQAAVQYQANVVLLQSTKEFYQATRLKNYLRTPKMKAPKGTVKYYYKDAFTLKAKGSAYHCR